MAVEVSTGELRGNEHIVNVGGTAYLGMEDGGEVEVWRGLKLLEDPYFDASDAGPTDNDTAWNNDANAFDGNRVVVASATATGTETTNELRGEGTNSSETIGTIDSVYMRFRGGLTSATVVVKIYTDGEGEALIEQSISDIGTAWSDYFKLTEPGGGWSWATVQALELIIWVTDLSVNVGIVELGVFAASSEPTHFFQMDAGNSPSCMADSPIGVDVGSSGNLHIAYVAGAASAEDIDYVLFNTTTDAFGTPEEAISMEDADNTTYGCAVKVDSNDIPHVVGVGTDTSKGTDYHTIYYDNRIGGSFADRREIEGVSVEKQCEFPDIAIDGLIPAIVYVNRTDGTLDAVLGNANDPTSFSTREIDGSVTTGATNKPTIGVDSDGNFWFTWVDGDGTIDLAKQAAVWTDAPTIVSNGNVGTEPSLTIDVSNNDKYIFYEEDGSDDIVYDKYTTAPAWLGETTLQTAVAYSSVKARRESAASLQTYGIDYLFRRDSDGVVLWDNLSIAVGGAVVPQIQFLRMHTL